MQPRLLALDLDGTLLDHHSGIPLPHRDALAEIRSLGVQVAIVTGRPVLTTVPIYQALGLSGPMVCFNGTWIGHSDGSVLLERPLDEGSVRAIVAALSHVEGVISCYSRDAWYMDRVTAQTANWQEKYRTSAIVIDHDRVHAWQGTSAKVMFVAKPALIPSTVNLLRHQFHGRFHVVASQDDRLEVHQLGITKAWGLEQLASLLAIPQGSVWAAGDADNDLEMISWAGVGCVMGQAPQHLRDLATHVLPPIELAGLAALPMLLAAAGAGRG